MPVNAEQSHLNGTSEGIKSLRPSTSVSLQPQGLPRELIAR